MPWKNYWVTEPDQTIIPVQYIDAYQDEYTKQIFTEYKFNNRRYCPYLESVCVDICIDQALCFDGAVVFTCPPSTMFYRKEKDIDSMFNLLQLAVQSMPAYVRNVSNQRIYVRQLFSINKSTLKKKKAQHIHGTKKDRIKNLEDRYYISFRNKLFIRKLSHKQNVLICIIDDVSSTGGTLYACNGRIARLPFSSKIKIKLFSLAH